MKRRQTRYTTENEILAAIDTAKTTADQLIAETQELEEAIRAAVAAIAELESGHLDRKAHDSINELRHIAELNRESCEKKLKRATRLLDVKLPKLKRVLAAFRTEPMPFPGKDVAVVG